MPYTRLAGIIVVATLLGLNCGGKSAPTPTSPTDNSGTSASADLRSVEYFGVDDSRLALATLNDGTEIAYIGERSPEGLPVAVSEIVVHGAGHRTSISFDALGQATRVVGDNGIEAEVLWNPDGSPSVTLVSSDGSFRFSGVNASSQTLSGFVGLTSGQKPEARFASVQARSVSVTEGCYLFTLALVTICRRPDQLAAAFNVVCSLAATTTGPFAAAALAFCGYATPVLRFTCTAIALTKGVPIELACVAFFSDPILYTVTGRVTDKTTGKAIDNVLIQMSRGASVDQTHTDADGRYTIRRQGVGSGVANPGDYTILALDDFSPARYQGGVETVWLPDKSPRVVNFALEPIASKRTFSGLVALTSRGSCTSKSTGEPVGTSSSLIQGTLTFEMTQSGGSITGRGTGTLQVQINAFDCQGRSSQYSGSAPLDISGTPSNLGGVFTETNTGPAISDPGITITNTTTITFTGALNGNVIRGTLNYLVREDSQFQDYTEGGTTEVTLQ